LGVLLGHVRYTSKQAKKKERKHPLLNQKKRGRWRAGVIVLRRLMPVKKSPAGNHRKGRSCGKKKKENSKRFKADPHAEGVTMEKRKRRKIWGANAICRRSKGKGRYSQKRRATCSEAARVGEKKKLPFRGQKR